jgi:hypothetical protein
MQWILGTLAILVFFGGLMSLVTAETVMAEIFAAVILCWSGVLFVGAAIIEQLKTIKNEVSKIKQDRPLGSGR